MTPTETATILRQFNEWRRGDEDVPQFDPREIGKAIDAAVEMIGRLEAAEKRTAEIEERCAVLTDALRSTAQTLAWMQHGKCRGFSDDLLTTNEALEKARAALEGLK